MNPVPLWQVDAFTDQPFAGNPAAVCVLEEPRDDQWMQAVAAEMNLSETAFVRPLDQGFELRWFTPTVEVDLCGHATLATAFTLWEMGRAAESIAFHTGSGVLTASHRDGLVWLDFPVTPVEACDAPLELLDSLAVTPSFVGKSEFDRFLVVDSAEVIRSLRPDFRRLAKIATRGVIVTASSDDPAFDFVSRFFGPAAGIDEDPVTGSAHCALAPYWAGVLNKKQLIGYQASARGGTVHMEVHDDRVYLGGRAALVMKGELFV